MSRKEKGSDVESFIGLLGIIGYWVLAWLFFIAPTTRAAGGLGIFAFLFSLSVTGVVGIVGMPLTISVCGYVYNFFAGVMDVLNRLSYQQKMAVYVAGATISNLDAMDGHEFERYLEELFRLAGYSVEKLPHSRDKGADLVVTGSDGKRIAVQAKRSSSKISNSAIQEVYGSLNVYGAHNGMVVTNNEFTKDAIELANANGVALVDRHGLVELMNKVKQRQV